MRIVGPLSPDPARPASHLALEAADLALIASGTATLEAALYQVPQVVAYQVPWLTERLMRRKAIVSRVSLPNLLLKQDWVPELLQQSCEPNALEQALRAWEEDPVRRRDYREVTLGLLDQLRRNAAQQVALVLQECLT
jgi:lipid-A-disaccharide synthase